MAFPPPCSLLETQRHSLGLPYFVFYFLRWSLLWPEEWKEHTCHARWQWSNFFSWANCVYSAMIFFHLRMHPQQNKLHQPEWWLEIALHCATIRWPMHLGCLGTVYLHTGCVFTWGLECSNITEWQDYYAADLALGEQEITTQGKKKKKRKYCLYLQ